MRGKFLKLWSHNLQMVIAASFTLITVIGMLAVSLIFYKTYNQSAEKQTIEDNTQLLDQVELNLTNYLRNMMRISDSLYYSVIKNTDFASEDIYRELSLLYEANKDHLVSIACFQNDGTLITSTPVGSLKPDVDVTEQSWFVKARKKPENLHFSSAYMQDLFVDSSNRDYWVVSLSRGIELTNGGSTYSGVLLVDMNFSSIEQLFTKVNSGDMCYVYLMDQKGDIIYHPKQDLFNSQPAVENNLQAVTYDDGTHTETFGEEERIVVVKTVGYTGWKVVSVIPKENLYRSKHEIDAVWVTVLAVAILLLVFVNQYLSAKITQPIRRLEDSVKHLELEEPEKIYVGGSTEIQHLGETIRSMVAQMRQLMNDIVREQENKRKNELDALQSQINPHFLYNTLDSIVWMVESERYGEAISMVTALANLFRISLSQGKTIITIEEEFQHAKNYISIQKVRYKNKFEVTFSLEEKLKTYPTIKLIIQPILENAIYYGMEAMDGDGEITVSGYERDGEIYIDVTDNGIGMPPEQVETLLKEGVQKRKRGSGIGLQNVDQRIRLYFGESYGLHIESEPDEGTRVTIHLPMKQEVAYEN